MGTVLMTNPPRRSSAALANPPGLALAVIGNPGRRSTSQGTTMKKKRSSKRRARRAATIKARAATVRRRTTRRVARRRSMPAGAGLDGPGTPASLNPSRKYWRVAKRIPWKNPSSKYWRVKTRTPWKNPGRRRRARRNPPGGPGGGGLMADVAGLGSALAGLAKQPSGLVWAGGGAAVTAVGGNLVAAQVAKAMPTLSPGMGRMVNAAVFAGVAVGASRFLKDPVKRRQMLAGGLAVAAVELLAPGKTLAVAARVPGLNRLLPGTPAPANPAAALAGPEDDDGVMGLAEDEPVAVDGIADDGADLDPGTAGVDGGVADVAGDGGGGSVGSMGDLVPTYLDGLGCTAPGRANALTKLVLP
jgi:hypothetical protein